MKCVCGAEVEPSSLADAVAEQIDAGEVIESVECSACPACAPDMDRVEGDNGGYVFQIVVE